MFYTQLHLPDLMSFLSDVIEVFKNQPKFPFSET